MADALPTGSCAHLLCHALFQFFKKKLHSYPSEKILSWRNGSHAQAQYYVDWLGIWYMFDQCCSLRLEVHNREWMYRTFGTGCWGAEKFLACVRAERRKKDPGRLLGASALQRCFLGVCGMGLKEKMKNSFHLMCDWQGSVYREISSLALQWEH